MQYRKCYEDIVSIKASPEAIFNYADDHTNFSAHMNQSSWMMGGGSMKTELDEGKGTKMGSHIKMRGRVFGINLFLDETITQHEPPYRKAWETVGDVNLLVIDHYRLGFEITPIAQMSEFRVYIDYNLPKSWQTAWLGFIFGGVYAKWCVRQMTNGVSQHFNES
ncbi:MAG: SRPBCC family protein [Dehalococcoidales bacterium]|nr:SRPBCC family protein [Dehalococcoidales bacterium]